MQVTSFVVEFTNNVPDTAELFAGLKEPVTDREQYPGIESESTCCTNLLHQKMTMEWRRC